MRIGYVERNINCVTGNAKTFLNLNVWKREFGIRFKNGFDRSTLLFLHTIRSVKNEHRPQENGQLCFVCGKTWGNKMQWFARLISLSRGIWDETRLSKQWQPNCWYRHAHAKRMIELYNQRLYLKHAFRTIVAMQFIYKIWKCYCMRGSKIHTTYFV